MKGRYQFLACKPPGGGWDSPKQLGNNYLGLSLYPELAFEPSS